MKMLQIYPKNATEKLEFHQIQKKLASFCTNTYVQLQAEKIQPITELEEIRSRLILSLEATGLLRNLDRPPSVKIQDLQSIFIVLRKENTVLEIEQILHLKQLCERTFENHLFLESRKMHFPCLYKIVEKIEKKIEIIFKIEQIIEAPNFIKNSASKNLQELRQNLQLQRQKAQKIFDQLVKKYQNLGFLAEEFTEGFMNNRRVLAVLSEKKRNIDGIFHGSSDSGRICYIEPGGTLEINREIEILEEEERKEIFKILKELTKYLREQISFFFNYRRMIYQLDFAFAKGKLALLLQATMPEIQDQKMLKMVKAVHPVLWLQHAQQFSSLENPTVPMNLLLNNDKKVLIISGPNAGGKTITLKTIGLHQLMLQAGLLVPCDSSSCYPIIEQLLIDIGDDQSIEAELSTYSSRLTKMKHFLRNSNEKTLFLIDEFGTGSDPELGGAMAEVILEDLLQTQAFGAVTTHYSNIKILAEREKKILNACMQYDEHAFKPLYVLQLGHPGSSYTFEVAQKIGFSKTLLQRAKLKVNQQKVQLDRLLHQLQQERTQTQKLQRNLENAEESLKITEENYQKKLENLKVKTEKYDTERQEQRKFLDLGEKYHKFVERWVSENEPRKEILKSIWMQLNSELIKKRKEEEEKIQKKHKKSPKIARQTLRVKEKIKIGSRVKLKGQNEIGQVLEIFEEEVLVRFGSFLKLRAKMIDLIPLL